MSIKRNNSKRKPLSDDAKITITIISIAILLLVTIIPITIVTNKKSSYISSNRQTSLNVFQPDTIEAVLSKVVNENGKVLIEEERILISVKSIRDIEFDGTTLEVSYSIFGDTHDLPNVKYADWQEVIKQFEK